MSGKHEALPETWLAVRLGAMGDVLLTSGVLEYWRKTRGLRFSVLTKAQWAGLLANHPAVGDIIALEPQQLHLGAFVRQAREIAAACKGWGLLDLHDTPRSRLLALVWQGPVRRYPKHSLTRRFYARWRWEFLRHRLEACNVPQRYALALESRPPTAAEVVPRIWFAEQELKQAREELVAMGWDQRPLVALHPFAAHPNKAWPAQRWQELAQELEARGWGCVVIGRGERPGWVRHKEGVFDFVDRTPPRKSAALLTQCRVLVSGDSGPMHLGVAAGTPTVALFGPTTRAWGFYPPPPHRVLERSLECRPCSLHGGASCPDDVACLREIATESVLQAVLESVEAV